MTARTKSKEILFIADAWDTLDHARDSTLHLGRVARAEFGISCFWATPDNILFRDGKLHAQLTGELVDDRLTPPPSSVRAFETFHSVHWRVDPPVNEQILRLWSLLACGAEKTRILNPPNILLGWGEKFAPLRFAEWAIPELIADSETAWEIFFRKLAGKQVIAKPAAEAASRGVEILPHDWTKARDRLMAMRKEHGAWLVLQEFDAKIETLGETRIYLLAGELSGAIRKTPKPGHPIMNLDLSDSERPSLELTNPAPVQRKRAEAIASKLASEGGYLATIDFIGDRVLEINVTSPGLIGWLDQHTSGAERLAHRYWAKL